LKKSSLGTPGNSIAGIVGGGLGGQLPGLLGLAASGGVGGGVLMAIIGLIKAALAKKWGRALT
jgi:uncharacterized membrane protein YeaQ/YmgE (transglycosylase-associated protein family)